MYRILPIKSHRLRQCISWSLFLRAVKRKKLFIWLLWMFLMEAASCNLRVLLLSITSSQPARRRRRQNLSRIINSLSWREYIKQMRWVIVKLDLVAASLENLVSRRWLCQILVTAGLFCSFLCQWVIVGTCWKKGIVESGNLYCRLNYLGNITALICLMLH